jgi:uncharacterized protein YndB with AHSA1/START domain
MGFAREVTTTVDGSPEAVFDYVSNVAKHGEWAGDKLTIEARADGTYRSLCDLGMMKATADIRVETKDRPNRFVYVCDDNLSGQYRWTFILQPAERGTRLTHRVERLRGPLLVRLIQPWLMWPLLGRPSTAKGLKNIQRRYQPGQVSSVAGS